MILTEAEDDKKNPSGTVYDTQDLAIFDIYPCIVYTIILWALKFEAQQEREKGL